MYIAQRRLFTETGGKFNDKVSCIISKIHGKYNIKESFGIFGAMSSTKVTEIAENIKENGYYIFEDKLPDNVVNEITKFSREQPARILDFSKHVTFTEEEFLIDEENILSPKYSFKHDRLIRNKNIQSIVFDENLLHIAQEYLEVKPIVDAVSLWWSAPFDKKGTSAAAQEFHFDMDRIKFLKFFIYLTDVGPDNGPHCYVPKSHKILPKELRKDGRYSDETIEKHFGKHLEICKPKATMMFVDTRGFHKGKPLIKGERLLFQMEFTNSLLGQKVHEFKSNFIIDKAKKEKYKRTYQLIKLN